MTDQNKRIEAALQLAISHLRRSELGTREGHRQGDLDLVIAEAEKAAAMAREAKGIRKCETVLKITITMDSGDGKSSDVEIHEDVLFSIDCALNTFGAKRDILNIESLIGQAIERLYCDLQDGKSVLDATTYPVTVVDNDSQG